MDKRGEAPVLCVLIVCLILVLIITGQKMRIYEQERLIHVCMEESGCQELKAKCESENFHVK